MHLVGETLKFYIRLFLCFLYYCLVESLIFARIWVYSSAMLGFSEIPPPDS